MKLKTGDNVKIMKGKSKGKTGKIIQVFPDTQKVVVAGANLLKKHLRKRKEGEPGRVIEFAAPLYAANVRLLCPACNQPNRFGKKFEADKKVRFCRKCKATI